MKLLSAKTAALLYVRESLRDSLPGIGFSKHFIDDLVALDIGDPGAERSFSRRHQMELNRCYWGAFQATHALASHRRHVLRFVPRTGTWLDVGCRKGFLLRQLSGKRLRKVGIDLQSEPEWRAPSGVEFRAFQPRDFGNVLRGIQPTCVTFTWVFHHMPYAMQERYFAALGRELRSGSRVVIREDAYAVRSKPRFGGTWHHRLLQLSAPQRRRAMRLLDYIANCILSGEQSMSVPGTFRTLEEWIALGKKNHLRVVHKEYLGFARRRDIHTPQSVIVFEKR